MGKGRKKLIAHSDFKIEKANIPPVVYGLEGIMSIFHVSKATASRYKNTILKPACRQVGRKIIVDTFEAFKIFGALHPERFIAKK